MEFQFHQANSIQFNANSVGDGKKYNTVDWMLFQQFIYFWTYIISLALYRDNEQWRDGNKHGRWCQQNHCEKTLLEFSCILQWILTNYCTCSILVQFGARFEMKTYQMHSFIHPFSITSLKPSRKPYNIHPSPFQKFESWYSVVSMRVHSCFLWFGGWFLSWFRSRMVLL